MTLCFAPQTELIVLQRLQKQNILDDMAKNFQELKPCIENRAWFTFLRGDTRDGKLLYLADNWLPICDQSQLLLTDILSVLGSTDTDNVWLVFY